MLIKSKLHSVIEAHIFTEKNRERLRKISVLKQKILTFVFYIDVYLVCLSSYENPQHFLTYFFLLN